MSPRKYTHKGISRNLKPVREATVLLSTLKKAFRGFSKSVQAYVSNRSINDHLLPNAYLLIIRDNLLVSSVI